MRRTIMVCAGVGFTLIATGCASMRKDFDPSIQPQPAEMAPTPPGWVELGWRRVVSPPYNGSQDFCCRFEDYRGYEGLTPPPPSIDEGLCNRFGSFEEFYAAPLGFKPMVSMSADIRLEALVIYDPTAPEKVWPTDQYFKVKAVRTRPAKPY